MSTITFDLLKLSDKLKTAGFTPDQAETVVRVIAGSQDELVIKKDLEATFAPMRIDTAVL